MTALASNCCSSPTIHPGVDNCSDCREFCVCAEPELPAGTREPHGYDPDGPLCLRCGYLVFKS